MVEVHVDICIYYSVQKSTDDGGSTGLFWFWQPHTNKVFDLNGVGDFRVELFAVGVQREGPRAILLSAQSLGMPAYLPGASATRQEEDSKLNQTKPALISTWQTVSNSPSPPVYHLGVV